MKNRFLRLASGLFVLCLITTSVISGTYAKYVTGDDGNDTARVAKWGVEVSTSGTLFGPAYAETSHATNADSILVGARNVASLAGDNVVAPGTKNSTGFQVKLTGTPEVAYDVTAKTNAEKNQDIYLKAGSYGVMVEVFGHNTDTNLTDLYVKTTDGYEKANPLAYRATEHYYALHDACVFGVDDDDYYPLLWEVKKEGADAGASVAATYTKTGDMANALVTALSGADGEANNLLEATYTITWKWAFEGNNAADTILGNIAAGKAVVKTTDAGDSYVALENDDYSLNVGFDIAVAVTQVN